ncbi:hypothetical protein QTI66_00455 [Variovorax sp. J22R133]|uniref:hypothetical protein n=1 Tax=Variovorax brevis TaxID=3053503 RepID=UPI002577438B|nr:hypothetical protein [Variovorax sp. J22R133]MDM0110595.1 hypothetical protein [Variovorax sp. J22R133]
MRALGLVGLLIALAIVGVTIKKQMGAAAPTALSSQPAGGGAATISAGAAPAQQVQQFKQSLDAAMQQPRSLPDDAR